MQHKHCWYMSGLLGQERNLYHHMKNHLWSSLKFSLAEKPTNCEGESYPTHHGKTTTSNIRNTDFNRTYSNWTFPNRILDRYLRWSECPHTYCLTPHKSWTIHHHTWRHLTLWTLLFTHRSWRLRKLHMNYSWHWSMYYYIYREAWSNIDTDMYYVCAQRYQSAWTTRVQSRSSI